MQVPKPAVTDRATAAALIAAVASEPVHVSHVAWRVAADALHAKIEDIIFYMTEDYPYGNVPDDWMKDLKENFQPKSSPLVRCWPKASPTSSVTGGPTRSGDRPRCGVI